MGQVPCGMTFAQRLRSTRLDQAAFDTYEPKNYYDAAAVEREFGHDAKDRLLDETEGIGYTRQDNNGEWWHKNFKTGDIEKMDEKKMDVLLGANDEVTV